MPLHRRWPRIAIVVGTMATIMVGATRGQSATACRRRWVGIWSTSPTSTGSAFNDQTLRLIVNPTYGGSRVRVKLSNRFGTDPVTFGAVTIARRAAGADVAPRSTRRLRFARQFSITVPPGGEMVSDPRHLKILAFEDLTVTMHVTQHVFAFHLAGIRVILGTQAPCKDYALGNHGTPTAIAARNEINDWIRTSGVSDGVVDFHAALRDPGDPDRLRADLDSGDHLHPSAAGYQAMADAVDVALLNDAPCR